MSIPEKLDRIWTLLTVNNFQPGMTSFSHPPGTYSNPLN